MAYVLFCFPQMSNPSNKQEMMKKYLLMAMAVGLLFVSSAARAQSVQVFINDDKGPFTNVRDGVKGNIVGKIPVDQSIMLAVEEPKNGWWRICEGMYYTPDGDETKLSGSQNGYWIHSSVIGISTRNYGGQTLCLRDQPSEVGKPVFTFSKELLLNPIDVKDEWVKVQTPDGKHSGWILEYWLCGDQLLLTRYQKTTSHPLGTCCRKGGS